MEEVTEFAEIGRIDAASDRTENGSDEECSEAIRCVVITGREGYWMFLHESRAPSHFDAAK
ncbi:hypothetical protein Tcan_12726 [Toxocara canis]|uniref:Uncharacterized protein n=1 Tax=Toxocara canis TaxID=6265 RepID=A0A0B2W0I6_TOXCA|nr:hypothetical protein Tcan_12726 [Toxocara canis]